MNEPYAPAPGYPNQPGYQPPPPPRQGMGCFAKGCLAAVIVLVLVGVLVGVAGWYAYDRVRPFLSSEPVAIRTYPATQAQYSALLERIRTFQTNLATTHAATLELSADDMNTMLARSPAYAKARGKMYLSLVDNQVVIETCIPLPRQNRSASTSGKTYYLSGKLFCAVSYASGEFTLDAHKIETIGGQPAPAFVDAVIASPDFNRNISRSFNDGFHSALRKNAAGEDFMSKVRTIDVRDNVVVITAAD